MTDPTVMLNWLDGRIASVSTWLEERNMNAALWLLYGRNHLKWTRA